MPPIAATIGNAATAGLDGPQDALVGSTLQRRLDILRDLRRVAERALVDATNAGAAALAHPLVPFQPGVAEHRLDLGAEPLEHGEAVARQPLHRVAAVAVAEYERAMGLVRR